MTTQLNITHLAANEGRSLLVLDQLVTFKVTGQQTGGEYNFFEVTVPPLSGPPALHTHPPQETFYVLEGEFEFTGLGVEGPYVIKGTAGSVVHVPKGAPHNYKNVGATPGRLLLIYSPTTMEEFFAELGTPVADSANLPVQGPPDMDWVMAVFKKHQLEFVTPAEVVSSR
jgi:quercetin dioxygenase-like cupin family protein